MQMHADVPGLKHCFDILHVAFMFFFYYAPIKLKLRFVQKLPINMTCFCIPLLILNGSSKNYQPVDRNSGHNLPSCFCEQALRKSMAFFIRLARMFFFSLVSEVEMSHTVLPTIRQAFELAPQMQNDF